MGTGKLSMVGARTTKGTTLDSGGCASALAGCAQITATSGERDSSAGPQWVALFRMFLCMMLHVCKSKVNAEENIVWKKIIASILNYSYFFVNS